ncbi:MAG: fructosamine kinase family protein [Bacteroidota bacterium]|nr:fructosamine kinase family protein [Bacteroidota bacterium]
MNSKSILQKRLNILYQKTGELHLRSISGGSINETYHVRFGNASFFCKVNSATKFPHLFDTERNSLTLIGRQNKIKTPAVIDCFEAGEEQFLLLEWIDEGERTTAFWKMFGEQLAALHSVKSETCGLEEDNYMGSVPQYNREMADWCSFFAEQRLIPMIERCVENQLLNSIDYKEVEKLILKLPAIFNEEKPSLLHGDLWSGNFLCNNNAAPVLIDPAAYHGHRSIDLAMTTLFGGFQKPFYDAYHYHYPLPENHKEQWAVCNLYPLLIHLYLFGTSYLTSVRNTLRQFA